MALALRIFGRMQGEKVYEVLRAKGRMREALEVAFERRARGQL